MRHCPSLARQLAVSSTRPYWCRFTADGGVSYTVLSRNEMLNFLFSFVHVSSRSGRSHFIQAPCFPCFVYLAFLWFSSVQRISAWTMVRFSAADAFATAVNETFLHSLARCSCVQWCIVIVTLLGPLIFLQTTSFLSLSGSQLLQFCCLLNPPTSLKNGIWLPWNLPPQGILLSLVVWSYCRVRSM